MTHGSRAGMIFFLAAASIGLIFDSAGLWRMTLCAALLHEAGHIAVYVLCARRLPALRVRAGGFALRGTESLSKRKELAVLAAGPLVNFLFAAGCFGFARRHASYFMYFFAAVHLCVGLYNCLPFGALDGSRILSALVPVRLNGALCWFRRTVGILILGFVLSAWVHGVLTPTAAAALVLAFAYLLAQGLFAGADLW